MRFLWRNESQLQIWAKRFRYLHLWRLRSALAVTKKLCVKISSLKVCVNNSFVTYGLICWPAPWCAKKACKNKNKEIVKNIDRSGWPVFFYCQDCDVFLDSKFWHLQVEGGYPFAPFNCKKFVLLIKRTRKYLYWRKISYFYFLKDFLPHRKITQSKSVLPFLQICKKAVPKIWAQLLCVKQLGEIWKMKMSTN